MITDKIDETTLIPAEYRNTVIPAPKSVKIELTSDCPYRCVFCDNVNIQNKGEMDRELFERLIPELVAAGVEELGLFFIGESFAVRWLPEAIRYAKDCGIKYAFLTTNGALTSPDKVEACMKAGLDSLKFSFNYSDGMQLLEIARVKPKLYDRVLSNIEAAHTIREAGNYPCKIYASSIKFDGEQQEKMQAAINRILPYVDEHYFLPLFSFGAKTTDKEAEHGYAPVAGNPGRLGNMREPLPCWSVFREGHIDRYGQLNSCCFGGDSFIMGDLRKESFMAAWNSPLFQVLRAAHLAKNVAGTPCEKCALGG